MQGLGRVEDGPGRRGGFSIGLQRGIIDGRPTIVAAGTGEGANLEIGIGGRALRKAAWSVGGVGQARTTGEADQAMLEFRDVLPAPIQGAGRSVEGHERAIDGQGLDVRRLGRHEVHGRGRIRGSVRWRERWGKTGGSRGVG